MKNLILLFLIITTSQAQAQMTAMDFAKNDCNGSNHHLFADLDSGKCVLLHFFMPNCGMCPPPAQALQNMANGVNAMHPGAVVGYAFPFNNTTTCTYAASWTSSNGLPFYTPMDSGANQVANYGGFGMPTVVLLGGRDHRVMYASQSFSTSDTAAIRDSIMARQMSTTGITVLPSTVSSFSVFPNPATDAFSVKLGLKESTNVSIEVLDVTGRVITVLLNEKLNSGITNKKFSGAIIANGNYLIRLNANNESSTQHFSIVR
jgi:hypothetical protein